MATASEIFCDICASRDLSNIANQWCPECEQGLCNDCIQHHSGFKLFRTHVTIDITNYKKLPDFVSSIKLSCEEHNEKFQLFCPHHDVACCAQCVSSSHVDCKGLLAMTEIVKNVKTSSALEDVENSLHAIRKNIEIIVKARAENLKDIESQFQNVKDAVNETRQRITNILDRLERDLLDDIKNKESQIRDETERLLKEMEDKDLKVQEYQENFEAVKEYGTDMQTFFGTREIAKYANAEEQRIIACFSDGTLNTTNIQFELHENFVKCLKTTIFGSILHKTTESVVQYVLTKAELPR